MNSFTRISLIAVLLIISATPLYATELEVPAVYPTIQAGIDAAAVGDTVLLAPGLYYGDGNRDIDFLGKDITVRSVNNDPAECTINCQASEVNPHRGFIFQSGETAQARLEGVTIMGGLLVEETYERSGAGILCRGGSPTIEDCRFAYNYSGYCGGGISIIDSSPFIIGCRFDNNSSGGGAGSAVYTTGVGDVMFEECIITRNDLVHGDLAYNAVSLYSTTNTMYKCIISDNANTGIRTNKPLTLIGCTITGNNWGLITHSYTIAENTLVAFNFLGIDGWVAMSCCNLYGNFEDSWSSHATDQIGTNGNISADPQLCDPDNWDYCVAPESPNLNSLCGQIGAMGAGTCSGYVSPVEENTPLAFGLQGNYPNPFNPSTTISYSLEKDTKVTLQVFDVAGKLVNTLVNGQSQSAGLQEAVWHGKHHDGILAASGVYFYVLTTENGRDSGRMALLK